MIHWGVPRSSDGVDDPAVRCVHEWVRYAVIGELEMEYRCLPIERPPMNVVRECRMCGHMKAER